MASEASERLLSPGCSGHASAGTLKMAQSPQQWVESQFPALTAGHYSIESPLDEDYNCIAYAAGDTTRWWWPPTALGSGNFWPNTAPAEHTVRAFAVAFQTLGYEVCVDGEHEPGYEKVAIYAASGDPKHAARQRSDGRWVSKLGKGFDIVHDSVDGVAGLLYGVPALYLRRAAD